MFTWKDYYIEYEQRRNQINEAKQVCLRKAFRAFKESQLRKSSARVRSNHFDHNHALIYDLR